MKKLGGAIAHPKPEPLIIILCQCTLSGELQKKSAAIAPQIKGGGNYVEVQK
jgi:hypothetical protein